MKKPQFIYFRRLDWKISWERFKRFFAQFPYQTFNAKKLEEDRPEEQIRYRRANVLGCANEIFRLMIDRLKRKTSVKEPLRFALPTFRPSLATSLFRTPRSIDRYIEAMLDMGFLDEKSRTRHGIELVVAASLFAFKGEPAPTATIPLPAAGVPAIDAPDAPAEVHDPWMQAILARTSIGENILKNLGLAPLAAPS